MCFVRCAIAPEFLEAFFLNTEADIQRPAFHLKILVHHCVFVSFGSISFRSRPGHTHESQRRLFIGGRAKGKYNRQRRKSCLTSGRQVATGLVPSPIRSPRHRQTAHIARAAQRNKLTLTRLCRLPAQTSNLEPITAELPPFVSLRLVSSADMKR